MGLYDELVCEYRLPDAWDATQVMFQTKDTPLQYFGLYILRADGTLWDDAAQEAVPYHGALCFYASNISGLGPVGCTTRDDSPPWEAEYVALYDTGRLLTLTGQWRLVTDRLHLTRAGFAEAMHQWRATHPPPPRPPMGDELRFLGRVLDLVRGHDDAMRHVLAVMLTEATRPLPGSPLSAAEAFLTQLGALARQTGRGTTMLEVERALEWVRE